MDPKYWEKVERLFHAALQVEEGQRAAVLDESCEGDESLRHEVESLLAHHEKAGSFIETPAFETPGKEADVERLSSRSATSTPRLSGTIIGHYHLLEEIGGGGMGVVYKAEDTKLGRLVALKFLPENLATDPLALERFRREARAASALNHPNICTIYDLEEFGRRQFIAMEYLEGRTFRDLIGGRALESDEIAKLGTQIAEALSAAHSKGVVHRDVKPGNIMVTDLGLVKVLDFGLAKLLRPVGETESVGSLTGSHAVTGTLPYMSPEQLRGREVDTRTDIYALGVVLYEMATGRRPFAAGLLSQLIDEILNSSPPPPRDVNPKVLTELEGIILKCLEKNPEDRYQTAGEITLALRRMTAPPVTISSPEQDRESKYRITRRAESARAKSIEGSGAGKTAWSRRKLMMSSALFVLAVALIAGIVRLVEVQFSSPIHSIAVLPFVDNSNDTSGQYITDGVTEGVIDKLSEIPTLRVMSRNSVFRFKGREADPEVAGRTLKVQAVLTGRVVRQADAFTISAELVNVNDGSQIWGQQFHYSISDLSRAQDELASAVSGKLKLGLSSALGARLARRATEDPEAYQLYLQARFYWNQRTPAGTKKSIEYFQQATEKDPNFALAYAGLADAYNFCNILGVLTPRESFPEARVAATKALVLDPLLGEAHAALGTLKSHYDFDFPGAQTEFMKAIELNPNDANAHLFYSGGYFTPMGRHTEAIAEMKKALELDPLSLPLNNYMGMAYLLAGDYDKSLEQFQRTIDLDPTFPLAHFFFSGLLADLGRYEEAIKENQRGQLLVGVSPEEAGALAEEYHKALQAGGPNRYWQKILS